MRLPPIGGVLPPCLPLLLLLATASATPAESPDALRTATFCTLHANLLLSTETFSPTHWGPLALAWGLSHPSEEAS